MSFARLEQTRQTQAPIGNARRFSRRGTHRLHALVVYCSALATLASCTSSDRKSRVVDSSNGMLGDSVAARPTVGSAAVNPPAMAVANDEQQSVLTTLASLGGKPIETLSAPNARKQPSPADAVMALLKASGKSTMPATVAHVVNRTIPTPAGALPIRIYTPAGAGPFPVMVYYHGGGFVIATMDTYDASARALVGATNAMLVSVEYRKAPEYKFPAAHDDAFAAYAWTVANAAALHGDTALMALVGESAGGNLAVATAIMARDKGVRAPVAILAVYPIAGSDTNTVSYRSNAEAKPLSRAMMSWFFAQYRRTPADADDSRLNLLAADLKALPPTTIINAQIDPLLSDGEMLASKMRGAGVDVRYKRFDGVAHEFFGQGAIVTAARDAVQFGAEGLNKAFGH